MKDNEKKQNNNKETKNYMTEGLSLGMCLGVCIGSLIKNCDLKERI